MTTRKKSMAKDSRRNSFQVKLDDEEKEILARAADTAGLTTAGFIRSRALEAARRLLKQPEM